ncbi:glycosyltransferase family 2 protein [Heyndrickxia coagulans]|uniref:glycosyltransferase family 2 protein n=1 Tax=Heyndrickxia coagulans TaxID=1398 RepID=UPI000E4CA236|nr:glycosyltransferase family 2 protein [Heyndrickxia coagulans]RGR95829.1 glycosyltransferase family 2 protein [Heyndrickxia coagulans]
MDKVAIIIINYNNYSDTIECLTSIEKLEYDQYRVYLVDNGSTNSSYNILREFLVSLNYEVDLIKNDNSGFAGGNNIAINKAIADGYKYFWLLNNDTVVNKFSLKSLMKVIKSDKKCGIVGSKIYYYGTDKLWFAGGKINKFFGVPKHVGIKEKDSKKYNSIKEMDYITGCSLLLKYEVIQTIGYMDESYFLYYEETDWNIRARKYGWRVVYVPESVVHHKISSSSGGEKNISPSFYYYDIRNRYIMNRRLNPTMIIPNFVYLHYDILKKLLKIFVKKETRKKDKVINIFKGYLHAILNISGPLS